MLFGDCYIVWQVAFIFYETGVINSHLKPSLILLLSSAGKGAGGSLSILELFLPGNTSLERQNYFF